MGDLGHSLGDIAGIDTATVMSSVVAAVADHDLTTRSRCRCGQVFTEPVEHRWTAHITRIATAATLNALSGTCGGCKGTGIWRKFGSDLISCPDCDGRGVSAAPLSANFYRDAAGAIWEVTKRTGRIAFVRQTAEPVKRPHQDVGNE